MPTYNGWTETAKTGDYTVVAADSGTIFTNAGAAGAVNFTLPTVAVGLRFRFFVVADQTITITATPVDTMIVFNDAAADSVALSTASEKIGGGFLVEANAAGDKWHVFPFLYPDVGGAAQTATIAT